MKDHIFDILGIGSREDSYTDLIAYAFEHSREFRKNILNSLGEEDRGGWKSKKRPSVPIRKSEKGKRKDIPDLILFNKETKRALLIENKIFSGEGWEQTERYASDEFKTSLKEHFKMEYCNLKFFFLTLDGMEACSSRFKTISYLKISECIPKTLSDSKLGILLRELRERIEEYYNWPGIKNDDVVLKYLKNGRGLVNYDKTFKNVVDNIVQNNDLKLEVGVTSNRGCGHIPLCIWQKKNWKSKEYPHQTNGSKCYNIHFELQWNTCDDSIKLRLDYHTNPYMAKKELKEVSKNFIAEYKKARDNFFNVVKEKAPSKWNISKTSLRIAYYSFDKNVKFGELRKTANELVNNMIPIVDNYLKNVITWLGR